MEKLIITAILDIKYKHKRPSMEEIFYKVKMEKDDITMDEFKSVFDEMIDTKTIGKFVDRDSYFIINDMTSIREEEEINIIKRYYYEEKYRQDCYIEELKIHIGFLKGEILHKNDTISSLISKIGNPIENRSHVDIKGKQDTEFISNSQEEKKKNLDQQKPKITSKSNPDKIKKNVEIIGDSILNGLVDKGLSKDGNTVRVRKYPGSTSRDLKHFAIPSIEKKPSLLIIHSGTNDITKKVDDTIENLQFIIKKSIKQSPHTKIAISALTIRKDKKNIENNIAELNEAIKKLCNDNLLDFIAHDRIDSSCLGQKQLHPNGKGNRILANDFINYIHSIT